MIVLDNSVLVAALVEPSDRGQRFRDRLQGEDIAVPELVDLELANSLRGLLRGSKISARVGELALREWVSRDVMRFAHLPLLARIWELRDNLTAYDATYIALAEALESTLVTADQRLASAPGIRCSVEVVR
jgi:predicted nucleic acid-binding protein